MISFLKLIRYKNLLMVLLTMVLTQYSVIKYYNIPSFFTDFHFVLLSLSILSITAGGYIINDIFDIKTDKINKPEKFFLINHFSKNQALIFYILLNAFGLILGIYISYSLKENYLSYIFIFSVVSLFFYSFKLKKTPLIGNLSVSLLIFLSIFIVLLFNRKVNPISYCDENGGVICLERAFAIFTFSSFAFLTTLIREIIKDIEDIDGDYAIDAKTLPIVIGRKRANRVAFGFSILLIILLIIILKSFLIEFPLFLSYSIVFVLLPLLYFMYKLWGAESKKKYSKLSQLMKIIMFFGILSMLFFKFI